MFTFRGPHIVMSRTDAQNRLDFHFKYKGAIITNGGGGGSGAEDIWSGHKNVLREGWQKG
jgi:hypothetical protein